MVNQLPVFELDFQQRKSYNDSICTLRSRLITAPPPENSVLELKVLLNSPVSLFLASSGGELKLNEYVIGFRGAGNKPFSLRDDKSDPYRFRKLLVSALGNDANVKDAGFGASHAQLGTYSGPLDRGLVNAIPLIAQFDGEGIERIRRPLALLVCMIAEACRFVSVQGQCADTLDGKRDFEPDRKLLTSFGSAQQIFSGMFGRLTVDEIRSLRSTIVISTREILRALHIGNRDIGVKQLFLHIYGLRPHPDFAKLERLADTDPNVQNSLEKLQRSIQTLLAPAPPVPHSVRPTEAQIDRIADLVTKLRDPDIVRAAKNLTHLLKPVQ